MDVSLYPHALDALILGAEGVALMADFGNRVRDMARANAPFPAYSGAIVSERGADSMGPYVDVGYSKRHPGFLLWWWEVGTKNHAPIPHLRPALKPGI